MLIVNIFRPVINILKLSIINNSKNGVIGSPIPSGASKGMPDDEASETIFDEEESKEFSSSSSSSSLPTLKQITKGAVALHRKTVDSEKIDKNAVDISEMVKRQNELDEQFINLTVKVNEFNQQKDDFKNNITRLANENSKLNKRYDKLKKAEYMAKQKLLENNFEITGVQQRDRENLLDIISKIATILSIPLNIDVDIISVTRDPQTRTILVCCNNSIKKQIFLDAKRGKDICSHLLNLSLARKNIKFEEQLTPYNKIIILKARDLKSKGVFDYVWSKNGRVFVKSSEHHGNKAIHIYCQHQLKPFSRE